MELTIGDHKVVLKDELTVRDNRQIRSVFLKSMELEANNSNPKIQGSSVMEMLDEQIRVIVLELDGSKENVFERLLDLKNDEYNQVVEMVQKIAQGDSKKKD